MTEHRGTSFYNSCVKVPVDPCSRQPTPSYERPRISKEERSDYTEKSRKINFAKGDHLISDSESSNARERVDNFLDFLESIPDYGQVHHLSNEQFKQKVDYLKRRQRLFLKNLRNSLADPDRDNESGISASKSDRSTKAKNKTDNNDLKLNGKKCYLEESRASSPLLFSPGTFSGLAEDQDLLTYRYSTRGRPMVVPMCKDKDKEAKTMRNKEIHSANKSCSMWSELRSNDSAESDSENIETKSLPPSTSNEWHPTVPRPFSFTLREEAERYMTAAEIEEAERRNSGCNKKTVTKKRRVRPIPITSKIPLYDKLLAEKEERSRIVREESALNLMSQVRPFKLECDRRAWKSLARSSPEIRSKSACAVTKFKAKPVPRNLFDTEVYDRMLEDEYYRQLKKKVRAAELMKSSSLPPSMARRERVKSAFGYLRDTRNESNQVTASRDSSRLSSNTTMPFGRSRSATALLPMRGNNLAAILRCQISREKLEREIRERMEEKRREQAVKMRESFVGRDPAWRALRSATRHEHERDLDIRTTIRREEAREQAERHRLQMEMMLNRVTQIPTLFERHSQSYQSLTKMQQKAFPKPSHRKKKKLNKQKSSSIDSYISYGSNSRPDSGSLASSSGTLLSSSQSAKSSDVSASRGSEKSTIKSENSSSKKKIDRGQLKVSINEKAELIEDCIDNDNSSGNCSSDVQDENAL